VWVFRHLQVQWQVRCSSLSIWCSNLYCLRNKQSYQNYSQRNFLAHCVRVQFQFTKPVTKVRFRLGHRLKQVFIITRGAFLCLVLIKFDWDIDIYSSPDQHQPLRQYQIFKIMRKSNTSVLEIKFVLHCYYNKIKKVIYNSVWRLLLLRFIVLLFDGYH